MGLRRWPICRKVLVNTNSGRTFRGVLWAKRGPLLVLRSAELLDHDKVTSVDGELVIERSNVDWIQAL